MARKKDLSLEAHIFAKTLQKEVLFDDVLRRQVRLFETESREVAFVLRQLFDLLRSSPSDSELQGFFKRFGAGVVWDEASALFLHSLNDQWHYPVSREVLSRLIPLVGEVLVRQKDSVRRVHEPTPPAVKKTISVKKNTSVSSGKIDSLHPQLEKLEAMIQARVAERFRPIFITRLSFLGRHARQIDRLSKKGLLSQAEEVFARLEPMVRELDRQIEAHTATVELVATAVRDIDTLLSRFDDVLEKQNAVAHLPSLSRVISVSPSFTVQAFLNNEESKMRVADGDIRSLFQYYSTLFALISSAHEEAELVAAERAQKNSKKPSQPPGRLAKVMKHLFE